MCVAKAILGARFARSESFTKLCRQSGLATLVGLDSRSSWHWVCMQQENLLIDCFGGFFIIKKKQSILLFFVSKTVTSATIVYHLVRANGGKGQVLLTIDFVFNCR